MSKIDGSYLQEMIDFYVEMRKREPDYDESTVRQAELELGVLLGTLQPNGEPVKSNKFEIKLEPCKGELSFKLLDYIKELSDETKEELIVENGWWQFISNSMIYDIKSGLATKNYNTKIYELRQSFLESNIFPGILKEFLGALAREIKWGLRSLERYRKAYYDIYGSKLIKDNPELQAFVRAVVKEPEELEGFNDKEVKEVVDIIMDKYGLAEAIEKLREQEGKMLAEKDPEASARAIQREKERNRYF